MRRGDFGSAALGRADDSAIKNFQIALTKKIYSPTTMIVPPSFAPERESAT
jgi:hypothetical protein